MTEGYSKLQLIQYLKSLSSLLLVMWFSLIIIHVIFFLGVARFFNGMNLNLGDILSVKICLVEVCRGFY